MWSTDLCVLWVMILESTEQTHTALCCWARVWNLWSDHKLHSRPQYVCVCVCVWERERERERERDWPRSHTPRSASLRTHTLTHIRPTHIINTEKDKYITHWTNSIKNQHKLECYLALNQVIHYGKLPEHRDWCETQENIDDVQTQWTQSGSRDGPVQTDLALSWGQTLLALHAGSDRDGAAGAQNIKILETTLTPKLIKYFPNLTSVAQPRNSASFLVKKPNVII